MISHKPKLSVVLWILIYTGTSNKSKTLFT